MYESGKLESVTKAQPGDLIFFRGTDNRGSNYISHIGIVAEVDPNGNPTKMAHASAR
jgi:cell wall-associated NlpC family hydrolase